MTKKQDLKKQNKDSTSVKDEAVLIVYNDDFNTFDHVISCLMKVCKHSEEQAVQCTLIAHTKGEVEVDFGNKKRLIRLKAQINTYGISSEVKSLE
ncbi:MAG: ATP-dependent Clp protease adaptor ClpS [Bacteroidota bacterium]|nr:ATP-dependent Clp protease adaptor ClpS [Bacteroidota bacterium]